MKIPPMESWRAFFEVNNGTCIEVKMRDKSNTSALAFERELPWEGAYHFSNGPKHESPCMDPHFRSIEYLAKKEQWMKDAGILGNNCTEE